MGRFQMLISQPIRPYITSTTYNAISYINSQWLDLGYNEKEQKQLLHSKKTGKWITELLLSRKYNSVAERNLFDHCSNVNKRMKISRTSDK